MTIREGFQLSATARRLSAVELVLDVLRSAILRGELPGGAHLVQTEIATQLNVSTTPVREAMRDLANEGLITLESHRIGVVRESAWEEMVEIVEVRRALEPVAVARAVENVTADELSEAGALADELSHENEVGSWVHKNTRFHSIFHRATRTWRLANMLVALEEAGGVFVAQAQRLDPEIRSRAVADHFELLEAFAAKDIDSALKIQHGHINLPLEAFGGSATAD